MKRLPFRGDVLSRVAMFVLGFMVLASLLPLVVTSLDPTETVGPRLSSPSREWWFGTDNLGRSILARVLEGIRTTLLISIAAVIVSTILAIIIAIVATLSRGVVDQLVVRAADIFFAFPAVLLAILVSTIVGSGSQAAILAIIFITLPLMVRAIRAASLGVADRDFITSSWVGGASTVRLAVVHILPNIAGVVVVQATYAASIAMLTEGALSFLGFGVQAPTASLGSLVQEGNLYLTIAPWVTLIPGAVLALAILSVNLLGDGLRDRLDPRAARSLT